MVSALNFVINSVGVLFFPKSIKFHFREDLGITSKIGLVKDWKFYKVYKFIIFPE